MPDKRFDVVGLGALNVDFIAEAAAMDPKIRRSLTERFARERERPTDDLAAFVEAVLLAQREASWVETVFGGSAYNTIRALAAMDVDLSLGYVGAFGSPPQELGVRLPSIRERLVAQGIDASGVRDHDGAGGMSLSLLEGEVRTLGTYFDAALPASLEADEDELVEYLSDSRVVHVTSLFGPRGPATIARLVERVHAIDPDVIFSVDPGSVWASQADRGNAIGAVLRRARYLFLNEDELCDLGVPYTDAEERARQALKAYATEAKLLLLKEWDRATCFEMRGQELRRDVVRQEVLPPAHIADSTGAGDVFAAGVLAGLFSDRGHGAGAIGLGLLASRHKLQRPADKGYEGLSGIFTGRIDARPAQVFLSHAAADAPLVRRFVDLLELAGVPTAGIFCTGVSDTGIPAGGRTLNEMHQALVDAPLVVALVTATYLDRAFCHYEIGAAWALKSEMVPLYAPPVDPGGLDLLLQGIQSLRIDDAASLDQLFDRLRRRGIIDERRTDTWSRHRDRFLAELPSALPTR